MFVMYESTTSKQQHSILKAECVITRQVILHWIQRYTMYDCSYVYVCLWSSRMAIFISSLFVYWLNVIRVENWLRFWNRLKTVEVIRPITVINAGNSSHLMIKKTFCDFHIVHYLLSFAGKVCLLEYM